MKYETQRVAYWYFLAAMGLFGIQVLGGLLAGWVYVSPNFLSELPSSVPTVGVTPTGSAG